MPIQSVRHTRHGTTCIDPRHTHRATPLARLCWPWLLFILPLLALLLFTRPAAAQDDELRLYDVEVLVFRHAGPPTLPPRAITDFTAIPIPLAHPSQQPDSALTPSPGMETAWRKLNNSGAYQALWFTRWRQAASNYNHPRKYRIHNDDALRRPQFGQPDPFITDPAQAPTPSAPQPIAPLPDVEPVPLDPAAAFAVPFPPTEIDEQHYVLDGWLSFSRQRFYHIALNLELRSIDPWNDTGDTLRSDDRINQNRRIEVGRFEYFDTPGLSVLVRVLEVEKEGLPEKEELPVGGEGDQD